MAAFGGGVRFVTIAEAAQAQNVDAALEMINGGCDVNARDMDGNTALHWAAWFKLDSTAQRLLERGARPDAGNASGETPVHWAAKASNVLTLDALARIDRGCLSQRDCDGFTPFVISAQNDNAPIMEWMYLKGISVEEQDDWGRTALQWACYKGHRRSVQWLLSRSASVAHRDHEGMTAVHWAALKGHEQVAEMLLDVGAVQLLHVPDAAGDTPIALAMRKKNRYLVLCFHKCQLFQFLFGRPNISHNTFATLFLAFNIVNILAFAFVLAPGIARQHLSAVIAWSLMMAVTLLLWTQNCFADPGWLQPRTIFPQHRIIGDDPTRAFDADQPVESQMVHYDNLTDDIVNGAEASELAKLELEQNKFNYQRQLITEARKRIDESAPFCGVPGFSSAGTGGTEVQSSANQADAAYLGISNTGMSPQGQHAQLEVALQSLQRRERMTGDSIGRARLETLLRHGCGEYLSLVEKGEFKQVCVVCRARREMRSHHCKECGRCVQRLDHHCPWIDNCVGLGNQRSFYCFIVILFGTIVYFYYVVQVYCVEEVFPLWSKGFSLSLAIPWGQLFMAVVAAFDLIWLAFVGALVARHTGYMAVNITTYEVLVRPSHVQRRFPKNRGQFWFLSGLGVLECFQNCANYWTKNTADDAVAFLGSAPDSSFVAPPGEDGASWSGKLEREGLPAPLLSNQVAPQQPPYMQQAHYQLVHQAQVGSQAFPASAPPVNRPRGWSP